MDRELFDRASEVRKRAHAPYSNFPVGAAVRTDDGHIYTGANVENGAFPEGWCAETSAIAQMVAASDPGPGRRIASVSVVANRIEGRLTTPCGGCRQRLSEFAAADTQVHVSDPSGATQTFTMRELLPAAFALDGPAEA